MLRQLTWSSLKWPVILLAVFAGVIWTMYVTTRLHATYTMQSENIQLKTAVASLEMRLDRIQVVQDAKLEEMQRYVFGPLSIAPPEKRTIITSTPQWQLNRDAEFRRRLTALEEWRYRTEAN